MNYVVNIELKDGSMTKMYCNAESKQDAVVQAKNIYTDAIAFVVYTN